MIDRVRGWLGRGALASLRALLPKNPLLRWGLLALLALWLLSWIAPGLGVVERTIGAIAQIVAAMRQTSLGKIAFAAFVSATFLFVLERLFGPWFRRRRDESLLGKHLAAAAAMVEGRGKTAHSELRAVAQSKRRPDRLPWVADSARLMLAREALARGAAAEALAWLERVRLSDLPKVLHPCVAAMRLEAWLQHGGMSEPALRELLDEIVRAYPRDFAVACAQFRAAQRFGDDELLLAAGSHSAGLAPRGVAGAWARACADVFYAAGDAARARGRFDRVRAFGQRLTELLPTDERGHLLLGDALAAAREVRKALAAYGAAGSVAGLQRAAELLATAPGCVEPSELLRLLPQQGALVLVAVEYARVGATAPAVRAARQAARLLGRTPRVEAAFAEIDRLLAGGSAGAAPPNLLRNDGAGGGT